MNDGARSEERGRGAQLESRRLAAGRAIVDDIPEKGRKLIGDVCDGCDGDVSYRETINEKRKNCRSWGEGDLFGFRRWMVLRWDSSDLRQWLIVKQ